MALLAEKTVSGRELKVKDLPHAEYFGMSEIELARITGSLYMSLQKYCCDETLLIHEVVKPEEEFANTGKLPDPESTTKIKFDNLYGCRPSPPVAVGCGYEVVEKPFCAVQPLMEAITEDVFGTADIYVIITGNKDIVMVDHMRKMKNSAIVGNIGHFDNNFYMQGFETFPVVEKFTVEKFTDKWVFPDTDSGINVVAEGLLMNVGCAYTGHPSFVMSCSFTKQAADINLPVEGFTSLPTTDTEEK